MSEPGSTDHHLESSREDFAREVFATTHWSVVLSARGGASSGSAAALEQLCRAYWYPLYAFARRSGHSPADAEDLTQGFFAKLLEKDYLRTADSERGRFRTFLLTAFKRYMANDWDREHTLKRGGFAARIAIDQQFAESQFATDPAIQGQPEAWYDRQWALTLLERTLKALEQEYRESGRTVLFENLRAVLTGDSDGLPYADIAQRLNLTEAAVKMAVHRLRNRYREILKREISETVASPEDADAELKHLLAVFR